MGPRGDIRLIACGRSDRSIWSDQDFSVPSGTLSVCEGGADFVYRRAASHYDTAASKAMRAAFSPIMIDGALVLPDVKVGMIEASATRRPAIPWTRS